MNCAFIMEIVVMLTVLTDVYVVQDLKVVIVIRKLTHALRILVKMAPLAYQLAMAGMSVSVISDTRACTVNMTSMNVLHILA